MPVHLPDGELVQGMAGSIPQPAAEPAGFVGAHFSADGTHFVFGSNSQFEPDGNDNGDVTIYDRDLISEETRVVSKTPGGSTMAGSGIGEVAISADGSRIVVGQLVSEEGNARHWHLYANVSDSVHSIDLTPGTTSGVVFAGMTRDGSRVFFTTADKLTGEDDDSSVDLYEAEVGQANANLRLVSASAGAGPGDPGNTDACHPSANTAHLLWNTIGSTEDCGVVAVGGGGVAATSGTVYFLSPEQLAGGSGVAGAPNLYAASPGASPRFVATLESDDNAPLPEATHSFVRSFGAFVRPGGVAIDHTTGDIYAIDVTSGENTGTVSKFDATGHLVQDFGGNGKITVAGALGNYHIPAQIAVDNAPAARSRGDLYVRIARRRSGKKI